MNDKNSEHRAFEQAATALAAQTEGLLRAFLTPNQRLEECLRAQLTIEELLTAVLMEYCVDPRSLEAAQLRFPQKVQLTKALCNCKLLPKPAWDAIEVLYGIRNKAAHRLKPTKVEEKISTLISLVNQALPRIARELPHGHRELHVCLTVLIGAVSAFAAANAGLAAVRKHAVSKRNEETARQYGQQSTHDLLTVAQFEAMETALGRVGSVPKA